MAESPVLLRVDGAVRQAVAIRFDDLRAMPEASQVADVSRFQPNRQGDAVTLDAVLGLAGPEPSATHVTLHADRDDFHVSIPIGLIHDQGLVIYKVGDRRLEVAQGGPIRLLIRDPSACHTGELDDCANVKYLSRIELTRGRGRDTRPTDEAAHQALHDHQG